MSDLSKPSEPTPPNERAEAYRAVMESAGLSFVNRAHARSFSLNILRMNALELLEAVRRVQDPETGLRLMGQTDREAGTQAHRELSRHIHNFAASANSLVDHTRVFLKAHYKGSEVQTQFGLSVSATIARTPAIKFVHDLRNYMVHRALPDTQMFFEMRQDPDHPEAGLQTFSGIRISTASLLEWDGWTADSKRYLSGVGEYVEIDALVDIYLTEINALQIGLDQALEDHHAQDLVELSRLRADLNRFDVHSVEKAVAPEPPSSDELAEGLSATVKARVDPLAQKLLTSIEQMKLTVLTSTGFTGSRPAPVITGENILGDPVIRREDASGRPVIIFDWNEGSWGLTQADYVGVYDLVDLVRSEDWGRTRLGAKFIEERFQDWARQRRRDETQLTFSAALEAAAGEAVRPFEVWAPVAHLEVEMAFDFGPIQIRPITHAFLAELRERLPKPQADAKAAIDDYFKRLADKVLGYAAAVIPLTADHDYATEQGLEAARDAVNLLRVYSPGAAFADRLCPSALRGADFVPKYEVLTVGDDNFYSQEGLVSHNTVYWRLSKQYLDEIRAHHLDRVGALVDPRHLSPFQASIRTALLLHSAGLASAEPQVRLRASLDALEQVLLRHEMEPKAARVADRTGRLLFETAEPLETGRLIRSAYRLRDALPAPRSHRDDRLLADVAWHAQMALMTVVGNSDRFTSVSDFVDAIEGPLPKPA